MRDSNIGAIRLLLLTLLFGALWGLSTSAQPSKKEPSTTPVIRLPSGAIIVVAKDSDSIDKPDAIYLSPEKFKEFNDQIETLKKQLVAEKGSPPSSCELEGKLEKRGTQSIVKMRAVFKFRTTTPRSIVFLGCQKARCVEAKRDDGKLPFLAGGDKGLYVSVESPGDHSIRLELELPLSPRGSKGSELGFELGLPGAPITRLTFDGPPKVKRLTIGRREVSAAPLPLVGGEPALDVRRYDAEGFAAGNEGVPLGTLTYLAVSWEDAGQANPPAAARSTEADVQVTVGETDVQTEARIRLKGSAKEWRLLAPFNAEVSVGPAPAIGSTAKLGEFPADQAPDIVRPEPGKTDWRVRFKEVNSAELMVAITARSTRNRSADPKAKTVHQVGPYAALDVAKQEGTIRVRSIPQLRITPILRGDTQRLDNADDPSAEAIYRYRQLPTGAKDQMLAPLDLDIRAAAGVVQARVHHHLELGEGGWKLRSEITVNPIRSELDALEIEVPIPGVFEASTPKLVESIVPLRDSGPQRRVVQVKLSSPQRGEFALVLDGFYPLVSDVQEFSLVFPRLLNAVDRAGQVTVAVPAGFDLRASAFQWESTKPGSKPQPLEPSNGTDQSRSISATMSRALSHIDLTWKPSRTNVRVESVTDITLEDKLARVKQQLRYASADQPLKKLRLRGTGAISGFAVQGATVEINGPGDWTLDPDGDPVREGAITLTWSFALPEITEDPVRLAVPMVWPDGVSANENRIRFLRDRDATRSLFPSLEPNSNWQELPIELLPAETTLLVVRGVGTGLPLPIALRDSDLSDSSVTAAWIDRALIQAQADGNVQKYRARFHLTKWMSRPLDLELPVAAAEVELRLNGIIAEPRETVGEGEGGRIIRIPLPAWREREQLVVEVKYQITVGRTEGIGGWMVRWLPPRPRGRTAVASVVWQIALPDGFLPLSLGDGVSEESWVFRNGHFQAMPAFGTAELDKWIAHGLEPNGSSTPAGWEMSNGGMTARQPSIVPLRIVSVPRTLWLLGVSAAVIALGLLLMRLPNRSVGVLLIAFACWLIVCLVLWPQPTAQVVAAAQPGLAFLLLVAVTQSLLRWQYRRKLARLPGFSRLHAESALSRTNGKRSVRETSTVDAPAAG